MSNKDADFVNECIRVIRSQVDKYVTPEITKCDNVVRNVEEMTKLLCRTATPGSWNQVHRVKDASGLAMLCNARLCIHQRHLSVSSSSRSLRLDNSSSIRIAVLRRRMGTVPTSWEPKLMQPRESPRKLSSV